MQPTDLPWGLWLILCWYRLHQKKFCLWKLAKITVGSHCRGRYCSCGGVPAPCWLWTALGCMLSRLLSLSKCLRFLPCPLWYPVKDTWWMRDQALKLQIVAWSTECINSSRLLERAVAAGNFCHFLSVSGVACLRLWRTLPSSTTPTILPLLCCSLLSSFTGKVGHLLLSTSKKWTYSLCMQSIHHLL